MGVVDRNAAQCLQVKVPELPPLVEGSGGQPALLVVCALLTEIRGGGIPGASELMATDVAKPTSVPGINVPTGILLCLKPQDQALQRLIYPGESL